MFLCCWGVIGVMVNVYCCVAGCSRDSREPEKYVIHSNVKSELKFHYFPRNNEKKLNQWVKQVSRGLVGFKVTANKTVCSNHFEHGQPTFAKPIPTLFMVANDSYKSTPKKRRKIKKSDIAPGISQDDMDMEYVGDGVSGHAEKEVQCVIPFKSALTFAQFTRDHDVIQD